MTRPDTAKPATSPGGRRPAALRYPLFARLWAGTVVSNIGTQMNNVAKLWVLYQLTRSPAALGVESLCFSVPIAVLPLISGPVADRLDRTRLLKGALAVEAAEAGALAVIAGLGGLRPWIIYLAAVIDATRQSFDIPARAALVPALVPASALLSAQSLSAAVWPSSALAGPALGGVLVTTAGPAAVFAINSLSTVAALAAMRPLNRAAIRPPADTDHHPRPRLTDGLRRIGRDRRLLALQVMSFGIATLMLGTETLLPVFDTRLWHAGSQGYGLLRMAPGIAAVVSGLGLAVTRQDLSTFRLAGLGVLAGCAGMAAFTFAPAFAIGLALLGLAAAALNTAQILATTSVQLITPDHLRGAVGGISAISQSGLAGIGAAAMALTAASLGARTTVAAAAALVALTGLTCLTPVSQPARSNDS